MGVFLAVVSKGPKLKGRMLDILKSELLEQSLNVDYDTSHVYFPKNELACLIHYSRPHALYGDGDDVFVSDRGALSLHGNIMFQDGKGFLGASDLFPALDSYGGGGGDGRLPRFRHWGLQHSPLRRRREYAVRQR